MGALYYVPFSAVTVRPAINDDYELLACCPNPFNAETSLILNLPASGYGKIAVYDVTGKQVAVIAEGLFNSGRYEWKFNGTDLASGVYFVSFESANRITTVKAVLLK